MSSLLQETKVALSQLHISPRKKFSQNYMISESELIFIRDCVLPQKGETVLEIGPGLGFLTRLLLERAKKVIAVERDPVMVRHLKDCFSKYLTGGHSDSLLVVEKDILKLDLERDLGLKHSIK